MMEYTHTETSANVGVTGNIKVKLTLSNFKKIKNLLISPSVF